MTTLPIDALPGLLKKPSKYHAQKTVRDGITFDSKGEADRYGVLKLAEQAGEIQSLCRQVPYDIELNGVRVCKLILDYVYVRNGEIVYEDFKGVATRDWRLKAKLFKAMYGRKILETSR